MSTQAQITALQATLAIATSQAEALTPDATTPPVTPPPVPPGAVIPVFAPPGGTGANLFNFDPSTMPDGPFVPGDLYGWWYNNTGKMNGVQLAAANASIKGGALVLKLASSSSGAAVTTSPWVGAGGASKPFLWQGGYRETKYVVPSAWGAIWDTGQTWPTDGEGDGAERLGAGWTTNYHYQGGANGPNVWPVQPPAGSTVTVGTLWVPGVSYTTYLGGVPQVAIEGSFVSSEPHCLILNIGYQAGGPSTDELVVLYDRVWAAG